MLWKGEVMGLDIWDVMSMAVIPLLIIWNILKWND